MIKQTKDNRLVIWKGKRSGATKYMFNNLTIDKPYKLILIVDFESNEKDRYYKFLDDKGDTVLLPQNCFISIDEYTRRVSVTRDNKINQILNVKTPLKGRIKAKFNTIIEKLS